MELEGRQGFIKERLKLVLCFSACANECFSFTIIFSVKYNNCSSNQMLEMLKNSD